MSGSWWGVRGRSGESPEGTEGSDREISIVEGGDRGPGFFVQGNKPGEVRLSKNKSNTSTGGTVSISEQKN